MVLLQINFQRDSRQPLTSPRRTAATTTTTITSSPPSYTAQALPTKWRLRPPKTHHRFILASTRESSIQLPPLLAVSSLNIVDPNYLLQICPRQMGAVIPGTIKSVPPILHPKLMFDNGFSLREEWLQRIARYKQRLGLLLPPLVEQLRYDGTLGS